MSIEDDDAPGPARGMIRLGGPGIGVPTVFEIFPAPPPRPPRHGAPPRSFVIGTWHFGLPLDNAHRND